MKKVVLLVLAATALGIAFTAGSWVGSRSAATPATDTVARKVLHYTCPMHPAYHSDRPGDCPSCGMRLEPVYAEGASAGKGAPADAGRLLQISAERQQTIGVRVGVVGETRGEQTIRTIGRVAADETRIYRLIAGTDGWIQDVGEAATGSTVRRGQRLGAYYSPDFPQAQQSFLIAAGAPGQFQPTRGPQPRSPEQLAADGLRSMGVSEEQLKELSSTHQVFPNIWIVSPAAGFVVSRDISPGQRFDRGTEFYRIADLSRVWIIADMFGRQADYIKPGTIARIAVPERELVYHARVSDAQPLFDETTRTLKVRLETDNPRSALKPGMFVDVDFPANVPSAITVASEAVLDSGLRKTVFVDRGNGYFEPRRVETGWRMGDRVQILKGLMPGERVVVSGNFLLDSESRMKSAAMGIYNPETDPVCGMDVDRDAARNAGRLATHEDGTYFFCSDECKKKFQADPAQYGGTAHSRAPVAAPAGSGRTARPAAPTGEGRMPAMPALSKTMAPAPASRAAAPTAALPSGPVKDLVCGMDVAPKEAAAAGRTLEHGGKTYYFCSDDCKAKFAADPAKYVKSR